jgi:hypothetical protein
MVSGMPEGRAAEGKTPLDAAKREWLEETGSASHDWTRIGVEPARPVTRWMLCRYLARHCQKVAEPSTDPNEIVEVFRVDLDRFLKQTVAMYGSVLTDFAEMTYHGDRRDSFARTALATATSRRRKRPVPAAERSAAFGAHPDGDSPRSSNSNRRRTLRTVRLRFGAVRGHPGCPVAG